MVMLMMKDKKRYFNYPFFVIQSEAKNLIIITLYKKQIHLHKQNIYALVVEQKKFQILKSYLLLNDIAPYLVKRAVSFSEANLPAG